MSRRAGLIILLVAAAALLGFIGYGLYTSNFDFSKVEPRLLLALLTCGVAIGRVLTNQSRVKATPALMEKEHASVLQNAFSSNPAARKQLMNAVLMFNANKNAAAVRKLEKLMPVCRTDDDLQAVNYFLAACYDDQGFSKQALQHYREVIRVNPNNDTALSNAGLILVKNGEYDQAAEYYTRAIAADQKNPYPCNNLAVLFVRQMKPDEAIRYAKMALERKPNMVQAMNTLAIGYAMMGDRNEAERYFQQSVANSSPNSDEVREQVDRMLSSSQQYKPVHMVIDEKYMEANGAQGAIEPVLWSVNIDDDEAQYERDLKKFSLPQRYVLAIQWYGIEVRDGGHYQFYHHSTGMVWEDVMKGFECIGARRNS